MSLIKANGNMYPWVTHMHSHLRGACPHACPYCYATKGRARRFAQGPLMFKADELNVGYGSRDGSAKTIFIEHTHDIGANAVKPEWVLAILEHCRGTPYNTYVFQTRNPLAFEFCYVNSLPDACMIGTTIETNRLTPGWAHQPMYRAKGLSNFKLVDAVKTTFLTIEPVLDFDVDGMLELIGIARPGFINIGADSKRCRLEEPSADKVIALIDGIKKMRVEIRQKPNLDRLLKGGGE